MGILYDSLPPRSVARPMALGWLKTGAAALALGATFGGGMLFQRGADAGVPEQLAGDAIGAAEHATERLERLQQHLALRYHQELSGEPRAPAPEGPDDADNTLRLVYGNEAAVADIPVFAKRFGCTVTDSYGSTEGGVALCEPALPSLGIDLDRVADVEAFLASGHGGARTRAALRALGWSADAAREEER